MSKMTVIQLLNKIANGEEIKAKLKFKLGDIIITYYGTNNYYKTPEYNIEYIGKGCTTHDFNLGMIIKYLNDEVEILEETPKVQVKMTEKQYFKYLDEQHKYMEQVKKYKPKPSYLKIEEEKKIPEKLKSLNNVGNSSDIGELRDKQQLNNHLIKDKINEIIDYLKSKGE